MNLIHEQLQSTKENILIVRSFGLHFLYGIEKPNEKMVLIVVND
jgi:hypothetical protein